MSAKDFNKYINSNTFISVFFIKFIEVLE